jgi:hypothetical protein
VPGYSENVSLLPASFARVASPSEIGLTLPMVVRRKRR